MNSRVNQTDPKNQPQKHIAMESRSTQNANHIPQSYRPFILESNKHIKDQYQHNRSSSDGLSSLKSGYFSIESMLVLVGLTASLLILPLMLPTLPPPPLLLLVVPIGILGLLMVIAFMPSNVRDLTSM